MSGAVGVAFAGAEPRPRAATASAPLVAVTTTILLNLIMRTPCIRRPWECDLGHGGDPDQVSGLAQSPQPTYQRGWSYLCARAGESTSRSYPLPGISLPPKPRRAKSSAAPDQLRVPTVRASDRPDGDGHSGEPIAGGGIPAALFATRRNARRFRGCRCQTSPAATH